MSIDAIRLSFALALLGAVSATAQADEAKPADPNAKPKINYAEHIQPIFREHCYTCHNQDQKKSDLALDSYGDTMKGGAGGEVVIAPDLESSRLWALVSHAESPKMPPEQDKLPEAKLSLIKQWILDGALENSGSKVKAKPKTNMDIKASAGSKKPEGPPSMPSGLFREPFIYTARPGAVTALAASPWAPLIALAGQKQVLLYNSDSGKLLGVLPFPEGSIQVLKFSRSGTVLLAGGGRGGQTGKVVLFDVKTGSRITEIGDEVDAVLAADINDDHTLVALGGPRRVVRIYSVEDGKVTAELKKHTDWIYAIEFSPDGVLLATTDRSGGVFIWESDTGREFQNLTGHAGGVTDVSWRIDSNFLSTSGDDGTVKLWDINNGRQTKSWSAHGSGAAAVEYARDGRIVSAGRDKTVKIWDQEGKNLKTFEAFGDYALEVAFTHDDKRVVAGDWIGEVRLWDSAPDGKLVATLAENPPTLAMLIDIEKGNVTKNEAAAAAAAAELTAAEKAATDATKAKTDAEAAKNAAVAAVAKATADEADAKKAVPQHAEAIKQTTEKLQKAKADSDKATREKTEAEKKSAESSEAAKLAAEKAAAATAAAQQVTMLEAQLNATKALKTTAEKLVADSPSLIKAANERVKQTTANAEKAVAAEQKAKETLMAKVAAQKAAQDSIASAKAAVEEAIKEKAAWDKLQQTQSASISK